MAAKPGGKTRAEVTTSAALRGIPIDKTTANRLKLVQKMIVDSKIPPSNLDQTLNIAIWNICGFGNGKRTDASILYIAEIIRQFDIIGIVELRENLTDLGRVMRLLGSSWEVIYSDCFEDKGGNGERVAFIFDSRAVTFNGLAGNQIAPRISKNDEYIDEKSFWRLPYGASFSSGNFDFIVYCVHARFGKAAPRAAELKRFADLIDFKIKRAKAVDRDVIVMGDFNTATKKMLNNLTSNGLCVPENLVGAETNIHNSNYDHILYTKRNAANLTGKAGVVRFDTIWEKLYPDLSQGKRSTQLSDHFPVWIQVNTDNDAAALDQIIRGQRRNYVVSD